MTLVPGVQVRVIRLRGKRGVGLVVSSKTLNLVEVGGATKWEKEISSGRFPASPRGRIRGTGASRSKAYRSSMPCPGIKRHVRCSSCRLVSTFHECPWIDPGKWHELLLHYFPAPQMKEFPKFLPIVLCFFLSAIFFIFITSHTTSPLIKPQWAHWYLRVIFYSSVSLSQFQWPLHLFHSHFYHSSIGILKCWLVSTFPVFSLIHLVSLICIPPWSRHSSIQHH